MSKSTIYAIAVVVAAAANHPSMAQAQACGAATDTSAMIIVTHMRGIVGSPRIDDISFRQQNQIPHADTTTINLITPNQVCQRALAAFNTTIPGVSPLPTKIYAVKVGTVYVVMYHFPGDHYTPYAVLDSKYNVVSTFAM